MLWGSIDGRPLQVVTSPQPRHDVRPLDRRAIPAGTHGAVADDANGVSDVQVGVLAQPDGVDVDAVHTTVAALYVDPKGVYANLPDVEVWDEARDARLYDGPWPVIAHPPCARWCALAPMMEAMHGYKVGDDGGCFAAALDAVRRFGGVLEHPAWSIAWRHFNLPRPCRGAWTLSLDDPGMTTEVDQAAYGHPARKRTWLYAVGVSAVEFNSHTPAVARMVSSFGHGRKVPELERVRPVLASATPIAFRDALLATARTVSAVPA